MTLDPDLQRILNVGAKIYHTTLKKQGKVYSNNGIDILVDYGKGKYETYPLADFEELLTSDVIVANSRVTQGNGENFKIKPREFQVPAEASPTFRESTLIPSIQGMIERPKPVQPNLEVGYINFTTNKFSAEPKKGYTKVEYRKSVEKVTLELTSEMIDKLKEMGLM